MKINADDTLVLVEGSAPFKISLALHPITVNSLIAHALQGGRASSQLLLPPQPPLAQPKEVVAGPSFVVGKFSTFGSKAVSQH